MPEPGAQLTIDREVELRYTSRKWKLVNDTVRLYTLVHIMNAASLLLMLDRKWLGDSFVKDLWTTSLTVWSAGVLMIVGWYMKKNVDQKNITDGGS
jgi:hypothetical protein